MNSSKTLNFLRKVKDITVSQSIKKTIALGLGVGFSAFVLCGCGEDEYENIYTKKLYTVINEVKPNEFVISTEEARDTGASEAHIYYLNGHIETINLDTLAKHLHEDNSAYHYAYSGNLNEVLAASTFGFMLSADLQTRLYPQANVDTSFHYRRKYYYSDYAAHNGYYAHTQIHSSKVVSHISSGSRRGFFGSFHSSGRG